MNPFHKIEGESKYDAARIANGVLSFSGLIVSVIAAVRFGYYGGNPSSMSVAVSSVFLIFCIAILIVQYWVVTAIFDIADGIRKLGDR